VNVGEFAGFGNPIPLQAKSEGNPMTDTHGEILTLEEVAAYLKAGKRTVYRLAQTGEIRRSELDSWIGEKKRPEAE
jgi:hypothetical protein